MHSTLVREQVREGSLVPNLAKSWRVRSKGEMAQHLASTFAKCKASGRPAFVAWVSFDHCTFACRSWSSDFRVASFLQRQLHFCGFARGPASPQGGEREQRATQFLEQRAYRFECWWVLTYVVCLLAMVMCLFSCLQVSHCRFLGEGWHYSSPSCSAGGWCRCKWSVDMFRNVVPSMPSTKLVVWQCLICPSQFVTMEAAALRHMWELGKWTSRVSGQDTCFIMSVQRGICHWIYACTVLCWCMAYAIDAGDRSWRSFHGPHGWWHHYPESKRGCSCQWNRGPRHLYRCC